MKKVLVVMMVLVVGLSSLCVASDSYVKADANTLEIRTTVNRVDSAKISLDELYRQKEQLEGVLANVNALIAQAESMGIVKEK